VEERFKDLTIALGALSDVKDSGFFKAVSFKSGIGIRIACFSDVFPVPIE
jgi:hypothetical protein